MIVIQPVLCLMTITLIHTNSLLKVSVQCICTWSLAASLNVFVWLLGESQINDVQRHFYDTKQTRVVLPRRGRCWYVILRQRMFWHNYLFITDCT